MFNPKANDNNLNSIQKFKEKKVFILIFPSNLVQSLQIFILCLCFFDDKRDDFALDINCRVDLKKKLIGGGGHSLTTWTQFCPFLTATYLYVDIFNSEHGTPTTSSFPHSH